MQVPDLYYGEVCCDERMHPSGLSLAYSQIMQYALIVLKREGISLPPPLSSGFRLSHMIRFQVLCFMPPLMLP